MKTKSLEPYIEEKRYELIWALAKQGYNASQIQRIFSPADRSTFSRIIDKMPKNWQTKWIKRA